MRLGGLINHSVISNHVHGGIRRVGHNSCNSFLHPLMEEGISGEKCTKRFCKHCLGNLCRPDLAMERTFKLPDIRPLWKAGYRIYTDDRQSTGFLGCQLSFYNGKIYIFNVRPVADIQPDTGYQQRTVIRSIPLAKNYL